MADGGATTLLLRNKILASLQPDARNFVAEHGEVRPMQHGDVIYEADAAVTHAVFPLEGVVSFLTELTGGKSVEMASVGPEGFLGFVLMTASNKSLGKSVVQISGNGLWLAASHFQQTLERFGSMRDTMQKYTRALLAQLMQSVACSSVHTAEQRVSRWLLQAQDRVQGDQFVITQEAISQLLSLRRATVNAVCTELMECGSITYNRGRLIVIDRNALHARCCDCYDRIRLETCS